MSHTMAVMTSHDDPRALRSKEAILQAARQLLLDCGPSAVTHVRVAEQSGVGRATVYRHWPKTAQLLAEAMATVPMPFFATPTEPVRDWLRTELTDIARQLELDDVRAVATTLANTALWDPQMAARRETFARVLADRLAAALDDAQAQGHLTLNVDSSAAAALLLGPLYYRSTIEHRPTDEHLLETAIASLGDWTQSSCALQPNLEDR
jgi:AcrR family transcriptional regulator